MWEWPPDLLRMHGCISGVNFLRMAVIHQRDEPGLEQMLNDHNLNWTQGLAFSSAVTHCNFIASPLVENDAEAKFQPPNGIHLAYSSLWWITPIIISQIVSKIIHFEFIMRKNTFSMKNEGSDRINLFSFIKFEKIMKESERH